MKKAIPYLIFIFLGVVLLNFFFFKKNRAIEESREKKTAEVQPTKVVNKSNQVAEVSKLNQTKPKIDLSKKIFQCKSGGDRVLITEEDFADLIADQNKWLIATNYRECFNIGEERKLFSVKSSRGQIYQTTYRGVVSIAGFKRTSLQELVAENTNNEFSSKEINKIQRRYFRLNIKFEKIIVLLKFNNPRWEIKAAVSRLPQNHPRAETIDLSKLNKLIAEGTTIFDVRPSPLFNLGSIPGAKNLPVSNINIQLFSPTGIRGLEQIDFKVPDPSLANKNTPMIIFSNCDYDGLSYNAITYLENLGYQKIYWFSSGYYFWKNKMLCRTPEVVSKVKIITSDELQSKILGKKKINLLHIRGGFSLSGKGIPESRHLNYRQRGYLLPVFMNENFQDSEFKKSGDKFDAETVVFSKNDEIIVYGTSDYDWRSLKAAVQLSNLGFKNIRWYRAGLAEWRYRHDFEPASYPLE